jgi:pentatricopeptide repeat protein
MRLSPRDYSGSPMLVIGMAHLLANRFEQAVENFRLAIQQKPAFPWPYRLLACCYGHLGRREEAREVIAQLREMGTEALPREMHNSGFERAFGEILRSGLRLAMGEPG